MPAGEFWTKKELQLLHDLWSQEFTVAEIAEAMKRTQGAVVGQVRRMRKRGDDRFGVRDIDTGGRRRMLPPRAVCAPDPVQCCFAHWKDLDYWHPSGWPSYRIESEFRSTVRPSGSHLSLVGSAAAMCENN
jgi:hypothetical protein